MLRQAKFLTRICTPPLRFQPRYAFNSQKPPQQQSKEEIREMLEEDSHEQKEQKSNTTAIYAFGALGLIVGYIFMQLNMMTYKNKAKSTREMKVKYSGKALM